MLFYAFLSSAQFDDKKVVAAGSVLVNEDFGIVSPSLGLVLNPTQLVGVRTQISYGSDLTTLSLLSIWFRHHIPIEASFPVYAYIEPEAGYYDIRGGDGLQLAANVGFSLPIGDMVILNLGATRISTRLGGNEGFNSRFNLNINQISAEFMVRF